MELNFSTVDLDCPLLVSVPDNPTRDQFHFAQATTEIPLASRQDEGSLHHAPDGTLG